MEKENYTIGAYVTNLSKYVEGSLDGEWVKFPTTYENMQRVFERICIRRGGNEEFFITDYSCDVPNFNINGCLGEYQNLDELNYMAEKIKALDESQYEHFQSVIQVSDYSNTAKDIINLTNNLEKYELIQEIHELEDLGRVWMERSEIEIPEQLNFYIDYEAYGRDTDINVGGQFVDAGYIYDTGEKFEEIYDGKVEHIPEEYRILSKEKSLPQKEHMKEESTAEKPQNFVRRGKSR